MTVLVTGASGFIGSHLVNRLKDDEHVVALVRDRLPSRWIKEALDGCIIVEGDIRDERLIRRCLVRYDVDRVYHLASVSIVKQAIKYPTETFDANVMGTVKILEACKDVGVERVIVLSTDKVFGEGLNKTENSPYDPVDIYGCSKACQDMIARMWNRVYDVPKVIVARSCNVYGYDPYNPRIIPNTIKKCLLGERPVIYRGWSGKRQYIYVEDLVSALINLMNMDNPPNPVNIAVDPPLSQEEVVKTILKFFPKIEPVYVEKPEYKEIRDQSMVPTNFGWKPKFSFESGIKETIERFKRYRGDWYK